MILLLASSNEHKAVELQQLLESAGIEVTAASKKVEVVEDTGTFEGNALKKAKAYYDSFKVPTLSDDSGLVLEARKDILGVESARFAPEYSDYKEKNRVLLDTIKELSGDQRKAYFVCHLCFYLNPEEIYFFEGRVHGHIGHEAKGRDGFGYDPVFYPDGVEQGKSLAQLSEWKMNNSHRAKSCAAAVSFFNVKK